MSLYPDVCPSPPHIRTSPPLFPFLSISFCVCPYLSVSAHFFHFLYASVIFLSISVVFLCVCTGSAILFNFILFLSVSVLFCPFLLLSISFCLFYQFLPTWDIILISVLLSAQVERLSVSFMPVIFFTSLNAADSKSFNYKHECL